MFSNLFKKKKIQVTPNVEHCFKIFEKVAQSLPDGDLKAEAEGAVNYLAEVSKGKKQELGGLSCPIITIIPPSDSEPA